MSMVIFNSLGSNYDFSFALKSLLTANNKKYSERVKKFLEEKYGGEVIPLYKGREALRLALKIIDKNDAVVAVCGYTCYAVYEPIISEGYDIEYLDIEDELHFSYKTLQEKLHSNQKIKIVIIQNTLGYPCDIEKIEKLCHEKKIILIEDLAHSVGTSYADGREAGTVGDFVILSFSQDKMIDGISGGALVVRDKNFQFQISNFQYKNVNLVQQIKDRFYPLFTYLIRKTYSGGVGKVLHFVLKKMNLLIQPMDSLDSSVLHTLPGNNAELIYKEFLNLEKNIKHRQKISSIYNNNLDKKILSSKIGGMISHSSNIRFPIFIDNRKKLIYSLKEKNIYISDIWFDSPIAPRKYLPLTNYAHQCKHAEKVSDRILNLPTHKNINESQAIKITELINEWINKNN